MAPIPQTIKVGFVGLSSQGWAKTSLAQPLLATGKYSITAVSTTNEASAKASAEAQSSAQGQLNVKAYHGSTSAIASDPNVDLVAVSVKAPSHYDAVIPVIEAGKDLFIEWPVGSSLAQTKEIRDKAKQKGIRSLVGLQKRHNPFVTKVKDLVGSGKIGRVLSTNLVCLLPGEFMAWGPRLLGSARYLVEPGSGLSLLSVPAGHQLDALTYVLGPITSVSATSVILFPTPHIVDPATMTPTQETVKSVTPDHITVTGTLKSGGIVTFTIRGGQASVKGRRQFLWEIDGEEGVIRAESDTFGSAFMPSPISLSLNGEEIDYEHKDDGTYSERREFEEFAKGKDGVYATLDDAVQTKILLDAIERSYTEGVRVQVDL